MLERALAKGDPVAGDCTVVETLDETETGIRYLAERHGHEVEVIEFFPVYATREGGTIRVAGAAAGLFRDGLAAFRKLGEFLRDSRHDSLGAVHDVKEADGTCYFIAERVEGADFGTALEMKLFVRPERPGRPDSRGRWDLEALLPRLLAGLAEVHRHGWMHGNIKAANVVLRPDSTTPVLVGFGLGPLAYGGDEAVGPWTDVRALGKLAHVALGGGRSDAGPTVREPGARSGTADRRLEEAIAAALESDRRRGLQDAAALLDLLRGRRPRFLVPAAAACGGLVAVGALDWFLLGLDVIDQDVPPGENSAAIVDRRRAASPRWRRIPGLCRVPGDGRGAGGTFPDGVRVWHELRGQRTSRARGGGRFVRAGSVRGDVRGVRPLRAGYGAPKAG